MAFPECAGGDGPVLETVTQVACDDFFSGIEVTRVNDPAVRRQAAQVIEQSHMRVDFGVHPVILGQKLNVSSLDAGERQVALDAISPYLEQAAELGAKRFALLSGPDPGAPSRQAATEALVESLLKLCAAARQYGLSVLLETFDRAVDKKALIGPSIEAAGVAERVKRDFPEFGLMYDQAHMVLLDEAPEAALRVLDRHLAHVHAGNCVKTPGQPGYGDLHPRFGFPGGENDVPQLTEFIEALFEVGYLHADAPAGARPGVGFEVKPQPGETSAAILANIKRSWNEAWARAAWEPADVRAQRAGR